MKRRIQMVATKPEPYIEFEDSDLGDMLADTFGDGTGITERQAKRVTQSAFDAIFNGTQDSYTSFNEFQYFKRVNDAGKWAGNTDLTSVILPTSCKSIGLNAFNGCTSLDTINLSGVTYLRSGAFDGCSSLNIDINMPNLRGYSAGHTELEYSVFFGSGITRILNIGSVTTLGLYSFAQRCPNLTEAWIPKTVVDIGRLTFYECPSLSIVVCLAETPPTTNRPSAVNQPFDKNAPGRKIYVPWSEDHSIINSYKSAVMWERYASDIYELTENGQIPE